MTGTVKEFNGLTEINAYLDDIESLGTADVPEPVVLRTGEASQEQWESVLAKVENVVVTNPDLGYGEWEVDDGSGPVRIDDLMYRYTPEADQNIAYIIGVVYYSYGDFKIEPRDADDIGIEIDLYQSIREIRENWEEDKYVVTSGIVIGTRSTGFFIQNGTEPNSGIYVYTGGTPSVQVGDVVQVNGTTAAYMGLYEIKNPTYRVVGTSGLPEPVVIEVTNMSDAYQSMRVRLEWVRITEVDGKSITIADDTGSLTLYDYYGIMDVTAGNILKYVEGIGYKYDVIEVYPTDYELYIPSIHISDVVKPDRAVRGISMNFEVTVTNNGERGDNVTFVVYANGMEIKNITRWIESGGSIEESFVYTPRDLGELRIDIQILTADWGITDERIYDYKVVPNPNTVSYGLTVYYNRQYDSRLSDLENLYENFTNTVSELVSYGVSFDSDVADKINWVNDSMSEVMEEYSLYEQFKNRADKTGFYLPAMIHLRKALFLGEDVKEEIQFLLPHLQRALEEIKAAQQMQEPENETETGAIPGNETAGVPTNTTQNASQQTPAMNITITIPKVLIDASHGQYYINEAGVSYLVDKIQSELGWEVEINQLPLTYDLLEEYDVVILTDPKDDFTPAEIESLKKYVENGGGLFIAGEWYKYANVENFNEIVGDYGITFNPDELMDDDQNSGRPYYPFVGIYNKAHPVMKFVPDDWTMYYNGDTLTISGNAVWLIKGYDTSYSIDADGKVVRIKGTNPVIAAAVDLGTGRIVAYGSSKALSDSYDFKYIKSSWPFIKGALLWLVHQE
ncbi:Gldg family protein [Thermococcus sp. JdF3]|uniref:Gldg family protein n=1 Tax=Thermococcus sp. JdF3 TaxID=1638258 RepID=UPI00351AC65A